MRRFFRVTVFLALSWAIFPGWTAERMLINGMAAKIGGQVVTVRGARFFMAIQRFCDGKDPFAPEGPGELKTAVQRLLLEEMVYSELKSLKFDGGPRAQAEKKVSQSAKKLGLKVWARILKEYDKSEAAAIDRVWKSLQVERFIQKRVETMTPIVTPAETDLFIRGKVQNQEKKLEEADLQKLRPEAAVELKKGLMRKELEEWIMLLKRKYSVTNYLDG